MKTSTFFLIFQSNDYQKFTSSSHLHLHSVAISAIKHHINGKIMSKLLSESKLALLKRILITTKEGNLAIFGLVTLFLFHHHIPSIVQSILAKRR